MNVLFIQVGTVLCSLVEVCYVFSKTQSGWEKKAFLCFIVFCFPVNSLALSQSLYKEALLRKDGRSRQLWADFNASPVSLHLLCRIQCQLFGPLCILQSGFYCAARLPPKKRKKEKEYKKSINVTFLTIVQRDGETWPERCENVTISFFWSVRNVVKQEGNFL